jgi:hypothetical protein
MNGDPATLDFCSCFVFEGAMEDAVAVVVANNEERFISK